jgi:zinc D-Ala-D-Ala carboxypeptidase
MSTIIKPAGNMKLSPNFFLSEFVESESAERLGVDNTPDALALANLFKLAALMEQVRALLGNKAIGVSSGYRGPALNRAIGGSKTSDHMRGEAADFKCRSFGTPLDICRAIVKSDIQFGQLIWEGSWVHISLPNRGPGRNREVMTAKFVKQANGKTKAVYTRGLP